MSHAPTLNINVDELVNAEPLRPAAIVQSAAWIFCAIGLVTFFVAVLGDNPQHAWGVYYVCLLFFMGMSAGAAMLSPIFQIVRALWAPPIRRLAEANVSFLPWAWLLFLSTYVGKEYLFPWARHPMPGREFWMEPDFVYIRFAILLGLLFFVQWRFTKLSLRGDIAMLQEKANNKVRWTTAFYRHVVGDWKYSDGNVLALQRKLSINAPIVVVTYAIIYSLFAFEMVMGMDEVWYSNMFGGFVFCGNVYMGWAITAILASYFNKHSGPYSKVVGEQQFWDLGKLTYGFCIIWGYMFFSQFLPQWYGNLPEETQWMILRTREYPWKSWGWMTFSLCFVIPFITLISRDLKKTPLTLSIACSIVLAGVWTEKYLVVMPQLSPDVIPFGFTEIGIFLGFLGVWMMAITSFLKRVPFVPISHPLTRGSEAW